MCDCSTYLAVRRGPRFASASASQFAFTRRAPLARLTLLFLSPPLFSSAASFSFSYVVSSRCQFLIWTKGTAQWRRGTSVVVMKARVSPPTGCEVRARINQAAQLGRLYSRNAILLLESVPVGIESRIAKRREFLCIAYALKHESAQKSIRTRQSLLILHF